MALLLSIGFHVLAGITLLAVITATPEKHAAAKHRRSFQVQLIALRVPPMAIPVPRPSPHETLKLAKAASSDTDPGHRHSGGGSAPQTLIVAGAPTDIVLKKSIPLPLAVPHIQEPVWTPQELTVPPTDYEIPLLTSNILSLPDEISRPATEILIPKVDQTAAGSGEAFKSPGTAGDSLDNHVGLVRLSFPRDGQNQLFLTGNSVLTYHPEFASHHKSKIVSTVYINIGLKKTWSLEYSAPSLPADAPKEEAALNSPWPYEIYRPDNVSVPPDLDAILVAGVLGPSGRLEDLQLLLPSDWQGKESLLRALSCWRFRPAARGSQVTAVDVLFVIPRQPG